MKNTLKYIYEKCEIGFISALRHHKASPQKSPLMGYAIHFFNFETLTRITSSMRFDQLAMHEC